MNFLRIQQERATIIFRLGIAFGLVAVLVWLGRMPEPIRAQSDAAGPVPNTLLVRPIKVQVDATSPVAGENPGFESVCGISPAAQDARPVWERWITLSGDRLSAACNAESLPVFAVRTPDGAALCIVNHSESKAAASLSIKLGGGVYTIERFGFDTNNPETYPSIERLEGVVIGGKGSAIKPVWLHPGSAAIYRITNRTEQTMRAFKEVKQQQRDIQASRPAEGRRLQSPIVECESQISAFSSGIRPDKRYEVIKHVHRALLTVAHAQALTRNFQGEGRLSGESGGKMAQKLNGLEEALTELSACCLNLVPKIEMGPPDPVRQNARDVTISISNQGSQTITSIKIGASAPKESRVSPEEQAMFTSLGPGQSVSAKFTVYLPAVSDVLPLTADIAYFAARVPAHLRLHPI